MQLHAIPVIIRERLYLPKSKELPEDLFEDLKRIFIHTNVNYYNTIRLGYYADESIRYRETFADDVYDDAFPGISCLAIPRGGTNKVRHTLEKYGYQPWWLDHRYCKRLQLDKFYINNVELWPEQERLVEAMLKHENCLIKSPTASGKTEAALKLVEYLLQKAGPVLIIVWEGSPKSGLMKQWIDRILQRFEIQRDEIGVIGGGIKRVRDITVGMQQTLRNCVDDYTGCFGSVICDEVQRFAANTFQDVIEKFPAKYRIGISADESRKDKMEGLIYDMFGDVVEEIDPEVLLSKNLICPVGVRVIPTTFNYFANVAGEACPWVELPSELKDFNDFLGMMYTNQDRETLIASFLLPCLEAGNITLVTTYRVEHAKKWREFLISEGYQCGLMIGGAEYVNEFEISAEGLRKKEIQVAVGTIQKMSTAHDIPSLERCFVLGPLAGNRQLFNQMKGRIGRTAPGKTQAYLYYFWDERCYPRHMSQLMKAKNDIELYDWNSGRFLRV